MKKRILYFCLYAFASAFAQNPVVQNIEVVQRTDGSLIVDIYYDATDADSDTLNISVAASADSGKTWSLPCSSLSGDAGNGILAGSDKHIVWDFYRDNPGMSGSGFKIRITADDRSNTVTDIDGNRYRIVQIGRQVWMADNLKVTRYQNGDPVPHVTDDAEWTGLQTGAYCFYQNDAANNDPYGCLYHGYAVQDPRRLSPAGWHVPGDEEWQELEHFLGMTGPEADATGWRGSHEEGGRLKESGIVHWQAPNQGATNESGFTALPGGTRSPTGLFSALSQSSVFWSSTESDQDKAWERALNYGNAQVFRYYDDASNGFSVRCVKGPEAPTLLAPSQNAVFESRTPFFDWSEVEHASFYEIWIDPTGTFGSPEVIDSTLSTSEYTRTYPLQNDAYYWKVRGRDTDGDRGAWSRIWHFTILSHRIAAPSFSPSPGTYTSPQDVTIACATPDAEIRYTTTGMDPTEADPLYSNPVHITATTTLKARGFKSGWEPSPVTSGTYAIVSMPYETGTMTDIDGNVYPTVKIGNQWWMARNLKVTHYRNGEAIPKQTDNATWASLTTGAYCAYNNDEGIATGYGYLYNWYAVTDNRRIAPWGWHLPTDQDWKTLEKTLGMSQVDADGVEWRGTNEGGKLKQTGMAQWYGPNTGATNETGFTAIPGGCRLGDDGHFDWIGWDARFWTATESDVSWFAWFRVLNATHSDMRRSAHDKKRGYSIRLVKD